MINKYKTQDAFDYENGYILTSKPYRLGNMLAHYELYKKIVNLPGDVIELGVFKGNSLIQFATFRELLENQYSRKIVGFDMFGSFPMTNKVESDKMFVENWNETFGNDFLSIEDLERSFQHKKFENIELIQGDILTTLSEYLEQHPYLKIALLHIDVDVYEPTALALELLFERVVSGGLIVLDDYGTVEGETKAVDEFLSEKGISSNLQKFSLSHSKPTFLVKK
ncbi:TylF/MycF family methyltransferase [Lysinibacillus sp. A4]|uniref:TylF/MycF family methyltransferase n=1 Tax=Lysinibacillus sp. A4 TaxID=2976269 RepID=UPI0021757722|nr:TylF/MycF family methyltransferase [Lysinibacillus sp. A4]MCS5503258.1 TylF/MycF family methyltransferase [Lysinibacillus sp. A4]